VNVSTSQPSLFALRVDGAQSTMGSLGVLESSVPGPSGLWASHSLPAPGYAPFSSLGVSSRGGVFAYRVVTTCPADYNEDAVLNAHDIFDFLGAWFTLDPSGDYNGDSVLDAHDIFAFLGAWFTGCP
jgi:hypothetical protein